MGYGNGGYGGGQRGGFGGGNGGGRGSFVPQPGSGTLFVKTDKRDQKAPDYDGYFIPDRDIRAGEKIKLVGWDKPGNTGHKINLKLGRDRQDAPGFNQGGQQGGFPPQNNGYPNQDGRGYQQPPQGQPSYGQGQQGRYQPPAQHAPGAYAGGGYNGQPPQTYGSAPAGAPPAGTPPAAGGPAYPHPPAEEDLPF